MEVSYEDELRFRNKNRLFQKLWLLVDPSQDICDEALVVANLGRIPPEEEARRRDAEKLKLLRNELLFDIREPKSKRSNSIARLKEMAKQRGVKITGLTRKADIAQKILDSL